MENVTVRDLTVSAAWDLLCQNQAAELVDVRTKEEWAALGVPNLSDAGKVLHKIELLQNPDYALNLNYAKEFEALNLDKSADIIFMCKAGGRSLKAAEIAAQLGYTNVYNIPEGFEGTAFAKGWLKSSLPVTSVSAGCDA